MIYLDHAAATPVSDRVLQAMMPYFQQDFFNPSAPYLPAKQVRDTYESAKSTIARAIGAKGVDLVMTSGATEATTLAFTVLSPGAHCLVGATEHASVVEAARAATVRGIDPPTAPSSAPVETIPVDHHGRIQIATLEQQITPQTELISIALADNEVGTIQPLAEVSQLVKHERQRRLAAGNRRPLWLHSDASQAFNLIDFNVSRLGVDLLTLGAAKLSGPKGIGALYKSRAVSLRPLIAGGGQEYGLRAGTENVPAAVGFATAVVDTVRHRKSRRAHYAELVQLLQQELTRAVVPPVFLGHATQRLANFCSVSFPGLDAERLIYLLESVGVMVSTGAACAASKGQRSPALAAIGLSEPEIAGSLRLSLGVLNDQNNVKQAAAHICAAVATEADRQRTGRAQLSTPKVTSVAAATSRHAKPLVNPPHDEATA